MRPIRPLVPILFVALAAGCAVTHERPEPRVDLPASFDAARQTEPDAVDAEWWRRFDSPELARLVDEALSSSPDLGVAVERVVQAEAQLRATGASLFPAVDLDGGSAVRTVRDDGRTSTSRSGDLSVGVSYELDLWGRIDASVDSARASLDASRYDRAAVRLSLVAGVANGYVQWRTLQQRVELAAENLAVAERLLSIVESRHRHGVVSGLDVSRQRGTVLSQRSTLVGLRFQARQAATALAVLIGRPPQGFALDGGPLLDLDVPTVSPGIPASVLRRRPDIAALDARLDARDADVREARAALLPSIRLTGSGGLASDTLLAFIDPTRSLGVAGSLSQSLFDAGRLDAAVDLAESRQREMLEDYRAGVLVALREVEDALGDADRYERQERLRANAVEQARLALQLADVRYREGSEDFSTVLDAQRTLFLAREQLVDARSARLVAAIDLFKVLGGGWRGDNQETVQER